MSDIFRTLIVTAADAPLAREIAATLSSGGAGMWTTPLSPTGADPATHYASSGWIPPEWQVMVPTQVWEQDADGTWVLVSDTGGDALAVVAACDAAGLTVTVAQVEGLYARSDVTEQEPFVALDRLGLEMVQDDEA